MAKEYSDTNSQRLEQNFKTEERFTNNTKDNKVEEKNIRIKRKRLGK